MSDEINRLRDQLARIQTALYDTRPKQAVGEMVEHAITLADNLEAPASEPEPIYQWRYYGSGDGWHDCVKSDYEKQQRSAIAEDMRFRIVYTHPSTGDAAGKDSVDAARYRLLRSEECAKSLPHAYAPHDFRPIFGEELDTAIDAIASLTKTADGEIKS